MENKVTQAECPNCEGERTCKILFNIYKKWSDDESGTFGSDDYYVLQCRGCKRIFFKIVEECSEYINPEGDLEPEVRYYPPAKKILRNNRLLSGFYASFHKFELVLIDEIYKAINNNMPTLSAMGIRSLIDHIAARLTNSGDAGYSKHIEKFLSAGYISPIQKDILNAALEVGHSAVHRGHIPSLDEVTNALDIVESIIEMTLINKEKADGLLQTIPHRPTKKT